MAQRLVAPLDDAFNAVEGGWRAVTDAFRGQAAGRALIDFVDRRVSAGATVYPPEPLRALRLTPLKCVRAVILGQDPYHGAGQAEGLAFSVPDGVCPPPSLRNVFKELCRDLGLPPPPSPSLECWARRGVLLLNTTLTVEDGRPASHVGKGWEVLTDLLIDAVARRPGPVAFLLWGAHAQSKAGLIRQAGRTDGVWSANHPSPLSATRPPRPFVGCGHFSAAASHLAQHGVPLDWNLAA